MNNNRINDKDVLPRISRSPQRRGATLLLFLVLLPLLIVVLGFSIDFARMETCRVELRRSADLAARASAAVLVHHDQAYAAMIAREVAAENRVAGEPLLLADDQILFGTAYPKGDGSYGIAVGGTPVNAVRIIGDRTAGSLSGPIRTYFGGLYNEPNFEPRISATAAIQNTEICLVLDRSSSMKLRIDETASVMSGDDPRTCQPPEPGSRWSALQDAVVALLDRTDDTAIDERVAIVTFASDNTNCETTNLAVTTDQELTSNTFLVRSALADRSSSVWGGNTDIASGIERAQQILTGSDTQESADKIMIVITDGQYTEADPVPYTSIANANGITVHTITFSDGANQSDMIAVANAGQGGHFHAVSREDLIAIFNRLGSSASQLIE